MNQLLRHNPAAITLLTLLCALHSGANAQETEEQEVELPQVYQVELFLFRNIDQSRTTGEIPRTPEPTIADILELDLARLDAGNADPELASPFLTDVDGLPLLAATAETPRWRVLTPEESMLPDVRESLELVEAYELLAHLTWLQNAPDVTAAEEIDLADLGVDAQLASGNVNLYSKRYLHIAIDVALAVDEQDNDSFGGAFKVFAAPTAAPAVADSRRLRLENLVYFDQPQFGVIAMVARSDLPLVTETGLPDEQLPDDEKSGDESSANAQSAETEVSARR